MMNLELLFRNVQVNNLGNQVTIVPLALSDKDSVLDLFMSKENLHWAGAHNSIGQNTAQDGQAMVEPKVSSQLSATGSNLISAFNVPVPTHIKIDVDGLESLVLQGMSFYIEKTHLILVEVDAKNKSEDSLITSLLKSKNFTKITEFAGQKYTENQLWKNARDLG
jgi:FkbM family methyltransferase